MPAIDCADATIVWTQIGHGLPVILIHGGFFDPMTGHRFWIVPGVADDLVAAGSMAVVPDRRFSPGQTTADFGAHSWDREADDLAAVIEAIGVDRAHIVAGSNGCSAATRLALRDAQVVASLTCCWPAAPTRTAMQQSFERSATAVERDGSAAYLDSLRRDGVPRPGEDRPGFPLGFALLHDRRLAQSFLRLSGAAAAEIMRTTAAAMLPGDPIRGLTRDEAGRIGQLGIPIAVMPAEPDDPYHPRSTATALRDAIPGAVLTRGFPITPSRFFAAARAGFVRELLGCIQRGDE